MLDKNSAQDVSEAEQIETAKASERNPETYLNHLLSVLPERFAADPKAPADDLLPWAAKMRCVVGSAISGAEHAALTKRLPMNAASRGLFS